MTKREASPSIQSLAGLKEFFKKNKARLAAGFGFFILPWLVNFTVNYEAAILVVLLEIGVLVYYRQKQKRAQAQ